MLQKTSTVYPFKVAWDCAGGVGTGVGSQQSSGGLAFNVWLAPRSGL